MLTVHSLNWDDKKIFKIIYADLFSNKFFFNVQYVFFSILTNDLKSMTHPIVI